MNTNANQVGEAVLKEAICLAKRELGLRLIACYALGSLAHDGFSPQVSDVDLAIILLSPLTPKDFHQIEVIKNHVKNLQVPLAERLSIFWGSVTSLKNEEVGGRFPPLDKLDLIRHGKLLYGREIRKSIPEPTKQEIEVSVVHFALSFLETTEKSRGLVRAVKTFDKSVVPLSKLVLFPVRFLYTASTGNIGSNDLAVTHYLANNKGKKNELVKQAFRWRYELHTYNKDTIQLMKQALIPLYVQFIDTYYFRMLEYKEVTLAENLKQCRDNLLRKPPD